MNKKIGKLQKDGLAVSRNLNSVLNKIQNLGEEVKIKFVEQNIDLLCDYAKSIVQVVQIFQVEEFYDFITKVFVFQKNIDEKGMLQNDVSSFLEIIHNMVIITDKLLQKYDYAPKRCPCCGEKVYYLPLLSYYQEQAEKYHMIEHVSETLNKYEYTCPCCVSSDRDRLMVSMLKKFKLDEGFYKESLLQIAPAESITHWINGNCPSLQYDTTDLFMETVTFQSDIQNMSSVLDESYDYIICSHVLEHVKDDRKAMRELYRILKSDGFCLFLVPIALDVEEIDEEWGLSEEENWRRFGQNDHCRTYSKQGLVDRLETEGFCVHELGKEYFGIDLFWENGLKDTSVLYVLTKKHDNIDKLIEDKMKTRKGLENEPLVSVIMSAYNHEKYVGEAIESVLNQTYQNLEFLVADDFSTDSTVQEIMKYEDQIDEIHVFDNNNQGRFEFLSQRAKGKYVAIMNSDDVWEKEKIEKQVFYLENHPETAACFTGESCINGDGIPIDVDLFLMDNKKKEEWMNHFYHYGNCLVCPSILIRKEIYEKYFGRKICIFRQIPDFWIWVQLVQKYEIHIIEKELIRFRFHESGDNVNTSACTQENHTRHLHEECYLWYDTFKKMDNDYFLRTFKNELIDKNVSTEEEILCEKFYVLKNSNKYYLKQAALFFLYDIYQDLTIQQLFKNKYAFGYSDVYSFSGTES